MKHEILNYEFNRLQTIWIAPLLFVHLPAASRHASATSINRDADMELWWNFHRMIALMCDVWIASTFITSQFMCQHPMFLLQWTWDKVLHVMCQLSAIRTKTFRSPLVGHNNMQCHDSRLGISLTQTLVFWMRNCSTDHWATKASHGLSNGLSN